jgi:type II secretory pathway component PulF
MIAVAVSVFGIPRNALWSRIVETNSDAVCLQLSLEIISREQYRMYARVELRQAAGEGNAMVQALDARNIMSCCVYGIRHGEMHGNLRSRAGLPFSDPNACR